MSYIAGALGVCVAAGYYINNMRFNLRAREMQIMQRFAEDYTSDQGLQRYAIVMSMEWKDYDDFIKKFGYSNPELWGKWLSQFFCFEQWGILLKKKIIDPELIYFLGGYGAIRTWEKFRDVIVNRRGIAWGYDYMINAEFLANEMLKIKTKNDASFKDKLDKYKQTWKT